MTHIKHLAAALLIASAPYASAAGPARAIVEQFLIEQSAGLGGTPSVSIKEPDLKRLPPCDAHEPFLPVGAVPRGRLSVGVRCHAPTSWTRYIPVQVSAVGRFPTPSHDIEPGQALTRSDIEERTGDLSTLPRSSITDASQIAGQIALNRIPAGAPIRKEALRAAVVISPGQAIRVVSKGVGFSVTTEAKAQGRAAAGQSVQAKTIDGRIVTGVATEDGQLLIAQ